MFSQQPQEKDLLKTVLEPLLEDFQYWFTSTRTLLESERLPFYSELEQAELLERIKYSQQKISTAQMLFQATEGKAGVDFKTLIPLHQLVTECWDVARKWRQYNNQDRQAI